MFTNLKAYIFSGIAAVFGVLVLLLKWTQSQRDKAQDKAVKLEREIVEQTELANTQSELSRAQQASREEAKTNEVPKTTDRPNGDYGYNRLRDKK